MAAKTWEDCFDYAIRLSRVSKHPPFSGQANPRFIGIQVIMSFLLTIRLLMTIILLQEGTLVALICLFPLTNGIIRLLQMYVRAADYQQYMKEINEFLEATESNPITKDSSLFMKIWKKEKPQYVSAIFLFSMLVSTYSWGVRSVYLASTSDRISDPIFWSPFFYSSVYAQWFYTLQELVLAFPIIYLPWYTDMTFTSLIKFHHAQLMYLRKLAIHLPGNGYQLEKRENLIWWYQLHQHVMRSICKVNDLLDLHVFWSYCSQTCFAVLGIIVLLFQSLKLAQSQRLVCTLVSVAQLIWFGYTCSIVDKWQEEHNHIRQYLFDEKLVESDIYLLSTYKIIMARLNKHVKFTGFNFVTLDLVTFRMMVINIYSLYTSLISILNSKASNG